MIDDMELIDLPLSECKFTWCRGSSFSRIDRVLINPVWLAKFQALKLWGLKCSVSDHVLLLVESEVKDWGPIPFSKLRCMAYTSRVF